MDLLMARNLLWNSFQNLNGLQSFVDLYGYLRATNLRKNRQTFSRRHWNRKCLFNACKKVILWLHKVLKFLMIYCLTRKLKSLILSYSTLRVFINMNCSTREKYLTTQANKMHSCQMISMDQQSGIKSRMICLAFAEILKAFSLVTAQT